MGESSSLSSVAQALGGVCLLNALYLVCMEAYNIRMYAINEFGRIIHEFDPYFNYRATEYLWQNGWNKFSTWFDYEVWYPLGRPVGTTIYPGMQVTVVLLKKFLLPDMSINDICVFLPAWFGILACLAVFWLTYEVSRHDQMGFVLFDLPFISQSAFPTKWFPSPDSWEARWTPLVCGLFASAIMSIVPAHLLRSVGGGYDNESIAMTAMVTTFAAWVFSLRPASELRTILCGCAAGVAYFYMVAAWGGYVFVLNLVGLHAAALVGFGRYSRKVYLAYTCFYFVGTALAVQVPVVGWTPLKSLEQLGPCAVFIGFQLLELCEYLVQTRNYGRWKMRVLVFGGVGVLLVLGVMALIPTGYFGPLSSRVRGLFVKHTKTGNPLVDSVAEHQKASSQAYFQYLDRVCYLAPVSLAMTVLMFWNDASSFLLVYGVAAYYFSLRMVRLILLTAPIASALGGILLGRLLIWNISGLVELLMEDGDQSSDTVNDETNDDSERSNGNSSSKKKKTRNGSNGKKKPAKDPPAGEPKKSKSSTLQQVGIMVRLGLTGYAAYMCFPMAVSFYETSHGIAKQISHPTIVTKARLNSGESVIVDDYREAYFWLRDNTPEDARIMAWWDYGYQITGIANRTTIADGNTWNHEHIALLGRILTSAEKESHRIARHLADYVLVWAGGGGDDVAKSPHLRRIANSVYRGLCREPTCRDFGFYSDRSPSRAMEASLLYKLHSNGLVPGVEADRNRFREVFKSKYGKVRIYKIQSVSKESKEWVVNNRKCDAPGSWFCPGQYPPALQKILREKQDFRQLEDFNVEGDDSKYQEEYFKHLNKKAGAPTEEKKRKPKKLSATEIDLINEDWENTPQTSLMHDIISKNMLVELRDALVHSPELAHIRSEDGRSPMHWAHEYGRERIVRTLKSLGASETRTDANGKTPLDISKLSK